MRRIAVLKGSFGAGLVRLSIGLVFAGGCGSGSDGRPDGPPNDHAMEASAESISRSEWRLSGGTASLDELGSAIAGAVGARDTALLESYRLTRREHDEMLWLEMPIARRKGADFPVELAWENISVRSAAGLRRLLATYGGQPLVSRGVHCGREQRYGAFTVHTDCRMTIVDPDGEVRRLRPFRSVVTLGGVYKIIRYERELD